MEWNVNFDFLIFIRILFVGLLYCVVLFFLFKFLIIKFITSLPGDLFDKFKLNKDKK